MTGTFIASARSAVEMNSITRKTEAASSISCSWASRMAARSSRRARRRFWRPRPVLEPDVLASVSETFLDTSSRLTFLPFFPFLPPRVPAPLSVDGAIAGASSAASFLRLRLRRPPSSPEMSILPSTLVPVRP